MNLRLFRSPGRLAGLCALNLALLPTDLAEAAVAIQEVAAGFTTPINLVSLPEGDLLIGDQIGVARVLHKDGKLDEAPFLDVRSKETTLRNNFDERGLLGLALHPKFVSNGRLFAYYSAPRRESAPKDWDHTGQLVEYTVKPGAKAVDLATERILLYIDEPQFNHNGGRIAFGPDGFLYIAVGDGGGQRDSEPNHGPIGNGQNKDVLLGKILRIDVDRREDGREYGIPKDNPFAAGGGRPEIFSYGHRNSWGISFDRGGKHEFFAAEVGENMWEEINIVERGGNYGWRLREGFVGFNNVNPLQPPEETPRTAADGTPLRDPIISYMNMKGHPNEPGIKGTSVTGGYVYRGKALRELQGRYVFADWTRNWALASGLLLVATPPKSSDSPWTLETLEAKDGDGQPLKGYIPALGEDAAGELYVMTTDRNQLTGTTGKVFKLVPAAQ